MAKPSTKTPASKKTTSPEPLTRTEREKLIAWQRWMVMTFSTAAVLIAVLVALDLIYDDLQWIRAYWIAAAALIIAAGIVLQFMGRCPRCHSRLGRQSGLVLPNKCIHCGVAFHARTPFRTTTCFTINAHSLRPLLSHSDDNN